MTAMHVLVVGGTRGIGRALVQRLVAGGQPVSVIGREPDADVTAPNLQQYAVDVTHRAALLASIDESVARFGKVAHAVFLQRHRAPRSRMTRNSIRIWRSHSGRRARLSSTSSRATSLIGRIHAASCSWARSPIGTFAPEQPLGYHVAKAALAQMARYYALTLGPAGVRVDVVSPCVVLKPAAKAFYDSNPPLMQRYQQCIPLGRMGTPEDIVNAILFFSSEAASYITGQNLVVDGGLTLRSHESLVGDVPESARCMTTASPQSVAVLDYHDGSAGQVATWPGVVTAGNVTLRAGCYVHTGATVVGVPARVIRTALA